MDTDPVFYFGGGMGHHIETDDDRSRMIGRRKEGGGEEGHSNNRSRPSTPIGVHRTGEFMHTPHLSGGVRRSINIGTSGVSHIPPRVEFSVSGGDTQGGVPSAAAAAAGGVNFNGMTMSAGDKFDRVSIKRLNKVLVSHSNAHRATAKLNKAAHGLVSFVEALCGGLAALLSYELKTLNSDDDDGNAFMSKSTMVNMLLAFNIILIACVSVIRISRFLSSARKHKEASNEYDKIAFALKRLNDHWDNLVRRIAAHRKQLRDEDARLKSTLKGTNRAETTSTPRYKSPLNNALNEHLVNGPGTGSTAGTESSDASDRGGNSPVIRAGPEMFGRGIKRRTNDEEHGRRSKVAPSRPSPPSSTPELSAEHTPTQLRRTETAVSHSAIVTSRSGHHPVPRDITDDHRNMIHQSTKDVSELVEQMQIRLADPGLDSLESEMESQVILCISTLDTLKSVTLSTFHATPSIPIGLLDKMRMVSKPEIARLKRLNKDPMQIEIDSSSESSDDSDRDYAYFGGRTGARSKRRRKGTRKSGKRRGGSGHHHHHKERSSRQGSPSSSSSSSSLSLLGGESREQRRTVDEGGRNVERLGFFSLTLFFIWKKMTSRARERMLGYLEGETTTTTARNQDGNNNNNNNQRDVA
jgi:hypothetical protein